MIDYLKFDIEGSEWLALPNLYSTNVLRNVKQIGFEIHISRGKLLSNWTRHSVDYPKILLHLNEQGFERWNFHENGWTAKRQEPHSPFRIAQCMELYYVNTRFM